MPLVLNEEQRLLRDTARDFLSSSAPVRALRKLRDEHDPLGYDNGLWRQMAQLGWASIILPEEYGGLDFGFTGLGVVLEECGRTLAASPCSPPRRSAPPRFCSAAASSKRRNCCRASRVANSPWPSPWRKPRTTGPPISPPAPPPGRWLRTGRQQGIHAGWTQCRQVDRGGAQRRRERLCAGHLPVPGGSRRHRGALHPHRHGGQPQRRQFPAARRCRGARRPAG